MVDTSIRAKRTIKASEEAVFAILVEPIQHVAIDGTGWVRGPRDRQMLTASGQIFRMTMYHPNHPDGEYETANRVQVFDPPHAISWMTGYDPGDGDLVFGGWIWRYDVAPLGSTESDVTLTYDWSAVPENVIRRHGTFPSFPAEHLDISLAHLDQLVLALA